MFTETIEDLYTLSPMQQGLLFHVLASPESGLYFEQTKCTIEQDLNIPAFEAAWQQIVNRHPGLRTAFLWEELEKPVQLVFRKATIPIRVLDWRALPGDMQQKQVQQYLRIERQQRFGLTVPPLLRLALIRLNDELYDFIMTSYHLVLDAWCLRILLREVVTLYESFRHGSNPNLPEAPRYRDYIAWLKGVDYARAERFWRANLDGFVEPTALPELTARPTSPEPEDYGQRELEIPAPDTAALMRLARETHITLNTIIQGAWAILLSHYSASEDVVFGAVVSGRPPTLANSESMIGLFINTLPVRIRIPGRDHLLPWLNRIQSQMLDAREYEDTPLVNIQSWSQVRRGLPIFNSVVVLLNIIDISDEQMGSLKISRVVAAGRSNYPLTLRIKTGLELGLDVLYDSTRFTAKAIGTILTAMRAILLAIKDSSESTTLAGLIDGIAEQDYGKGAVPSVPELRAPDLRSIKPRPLRVSRTSLIAKSYLNPESTLPLVLQPALGPLDLLSWTRGNQQSIADELAVHGGILFRGFGVDSLATFEQFAKLVSPTLLEYRERSTPRTEIGDRIYTSTEYPADQRIAMHNEFSYALAWPMRICFYCAKAARAGGETPIADARKVFQLISPGTRDLFLRKRVMYVRNYGTGLDLPWQEVFQTSDRAVAEEYCRKAFVDFEWKDPQHLSTRQVRPSARSHPGTGEMVWFNQAHLFHISNLQTSLGDSMRDVLGDSKLPRNAYYGDGSIIGVETLEEVREAYQRAQVQFSWQAGDILLLDNMLVAHGRNSFVGERKIAVAMGDPFTGDA